MKLTLKKTCVLAALPLILSLIAVPAAYARSPRSDWLAAGGIPRGSYLLIPYRNSEARLDMRGLDGAGGPPAMARSPDRAHDPFSDTYFD
jgi:hypothetical protein